MVSQDSEPKWFDELCIRVQYILQDSIGLLLEGPVGCGKTRLARQSAVRSGHKLLCLQLGDQSDTRALLGGYCATAAPGQFVWRSGPLTEAAQRGHWLLLEDIDCAPDEILALVQPLLEVGCNGTLSVPHEPQAITPHNNFRILATRRLGVVAASPGSFFALRRPRLLQERLWRRMVLASLQDEELTAIVFCHFQALSASMLRCVLAAYQKIVQADEESRLGRPVTPRDVLKLCSRLAAVAGLNLSPQQQLFEALDCLVAAVPEQQRRLHLASLVATCFDVSPTETTHLLMERMPEICVGMATETWLRFGRVKLHKRNLESLQQLRQEAADPFFTFTRGSARLLEQLASCVQHGEPALLVGETGCGKTAAVQYLAAKSGHTLRVINLNQQSDAADLLGGFRPVELRIALRPAMESFERLFLATYDSAKNMAFLRHVRHLWEGAPTRSDDLLTLMQRATDVAVARQSKQETLGVAWRRLQMHLRDIRLQLRAMADSAAPAFAWINGALVEAVQGGEWLLLDEVNMGSSELLECLAGLLEPDSSGLTLTERGDLEPVTRHSNFRLFACMNPATDVGKRELPTGLRSRFTEFFVDEPENEQVMV